MEKCRESTVYHKSQLFWLLLAVIALLIWSAAEFKSYFAGKPSYLGIGYILFFIGILIWRYAFRYTCILNEHEMIVISQGLGISRTVRINLDDVESFADRYVKSFFRRTGISRYLYRYSSGDNRPIRILVFKKKTKMHAVLFKSSDKFIEELANLKPKQYLKLASDGSKK
ncbi:hypothetical protein SCACP_13410 [Sporomusa carbonis]|uniref:hypothetical protein n=1 Tax=Sporomusa carbonis TaxID=3076075 RepID=UPI003A78089A